MGNEYMNGRYDAQTELIEYLHEVTDGEFMELSANDFQGLLKIIYNLSVEFNVNQVNDDGEVIATTTFYNYDVAVRYYNAMGKVNKELVGYDNYNCENDILYDFYCNDDTRPLNTLTIEKRGAK